ncbi:MAG: carbamoyltransferase HypF [Burkholderiaceae bacterium]
MPRAAPARVLAVGAWLKNTACLLDGHSVHWSPLHGDLATPQACVALEASVRALLAQSGGRVDAVAHDLHPDFESTRLAVALAAELGVPAVPVQHHHAHIGVLQAEQGRSDGVIGLALDGVGLGTDGVAWGGELLHVAGAAWQRVAHLSPLALPGGDVAAREPWRMAAAALHAMGRGDEIVPRFAPAVGATLAAGVRTMLDRALNCPPTTSTGRWFDAIAGLLGLSVRQAAEAEAAIALERAAARALARGEAAPIVDAKELRPLAAECLDLRPLAAACLARAATGDVDAAAALFHLGLADALARAATAAAQAHGTRTVMLGGGCFYNRVLTERLGAALAAAGLAVHAVQGPGPGDAGLALGQAWIAAHALAGGAPSIARDAEAASCA